MSIAAFKWLPIVALVLGCHAPGSFAQPVSGATAQRHANAVDPHATELPLAELEKFFWICDHAATTGLLDSGTAMTCGSLTEALKQRKFDGDFKAMLAWWRQHKEAEHLAQAAGVPPAPLARLTPTAPK